MMTEAIQQDLFQVKPGGKILTDSEIEEWIAEEILSIVQAQCQPGPGELLDALERKFGWPVRMYVYPVISKLRSTTSLQGFQREYFRKTLPDSEIAAALMGDAKPMQQHQNSVDNLLKKSLAYRKSAAFREMIEFMAKFRDYAPYNNLLVKVQNPSCGFYATEKDWRERFKRVIKEDARPMLILAPMHPVMPVYDLDSTEGVPGGPPLPKKLEDFTKTIGVWDERVFDYTLDNAQRDKFLVQFKNLSSTHGGFATTRLRNGDYKMRIAIHAGLDAKSRYSVLCHELAHIYLGHLGSDRDNWWPCRINLSHRAVEIEAEAVASIVSTRIGLQPSSEKYLASYVTDDGIPESVSVELISRVAGKLEEMGKRKLTPRKSKETLT